MVIYPSNKTFSSKMEWTTDICKNLDKSQRYFAVWKRPMSKSYILYHSMHTTISKKQKHSNEKQISDRQRLRVGEAYNHKGIGWAELSFLFVLKLWNCSVSWLCWWLHKFKYVLKFKELYTEIKDQILSLI